MIIATFNVNSIRSRLEVVLEWLKARRPDVMCLQETKVVDDLFPAGPLREAGYHVVYRGEKAYNGVALLSLTAPTEVRFGLDDGGPADEARLVAAKVGPIHVVNTYVPQGRDIEHEMYRYKLQWFDRLRRFLDRHYSARGNVVWTGDLNVAPEAMDIHNAERQANHVCYHVEARAAFGRAVEWGFVDVFRKHHPEPGQYTFFDYRQRDALGKNQGWRIDHMMATRSLAGKSMGAGIDLEPRRKPVPSDHTVLWAEFEV
jgi:exodeoxyribonuclease-3